MCDIQIAVQRCANDRARGRRSRLRRVSREGGDETVEYTRFLTGETHPLKISRVELPATKKMLVKHCMAESSGIGYDQWTDVELRFGIPLGKEYGAAQALRRATGGAYSSTCIIGQPMTLEAYCDAIAAAGVLVCEPGTFSYGLGALVVGRVCEVAFERSTGRKERFSRIVDELLFRPLGMTSAAFYLEDGDPRASRVPELYGGALARSDESCVAKPYVSSRVAASNERRLFDAPPRS